MTVTPNSLPIWAIHDDLVATLRSGNRLVLIAPTGSGKTTQVPQMLLDAGLADGGTAGARKIVVLQPRRVAARTVAARVASERGTRLGDLVGYQIRFEDRTSLGTRICFVTEGILLRWLQDDRALSDVAVILFDEFHERNLLSDVALALVKQLQATVRPDLKLAVMSATLDVRPVARYLDDCPVLAAEGRTYPVEVRYLACHDERPLTEQAADAVEAIVHAGESGDILVFMPGMAEINATLHALRAARIGEPVALIPLHGDLPPEDQDRAFLPSPVRKVIVSTNVAETSVTIDGVRHVVDSGVARVARYDAERGLGTLLVEPISRSSAEQRKGRAGRTDAGTCHRLWTESGHLNRPEHNTPEIQRSDLAEVVLLLHSLGIRHAARFDWLDKPDPQAVERAERLLITLGALLPDAAGSVEDDRGASAPDLTAVGRQMLRLPMHPRYSRMLVEAARRGCVRQAALCAALVSGRDLMMRLSRDDSHIAEARELFEASQSSDFYTLIRAYQFARNRGFSVDACRRYGIHAQTARQVDLTYGQLLEIAARQGMLPGGEEEENAEEPEGKTGARRREVVDDPLLRCLLAGFVDQLCVRRDQGTLDCDLTEGRSGVLVRESVVQNSPLLVVASIREVSGRGSGNLTLLGLASAVKREWVEEMFPQLLTSRVEHLYDRTHRRVAAIRLVRFLDLVVHHEHQRDVDPEASGRCLAEAYGKKLFELPLIDHDVRQFMARVNLVSAAMPDLEVPALDAAALGRCLARAFAGITTVKEAQGTPVRDAILGHLAKGQRAWVEELAPASVPWPDGRKLKLLYAITDDGEEGGVTPELQVKLQECFKLAEHPRLCEGRVPVRIWLCTPEGKRLESTTDWPAFRAGPYAKHRPNLMKKFPGFVWP